jgi:anti-anti-sigma factor
MKDFGVEIVPLDRVTLIRCSGALEDAATTELHRAVTPLLPVQPHFVLALPGVEYVDSFGLGDLTRLHGAVQNAGGRLTICAVPAPVARVLTVTGLADVLEIDATESARLWPPSRRAGVPPAPRATSAPMCSVSSPHRNCWHWCGRCSRAQVCASGPRTISPTRSRCCAPRAQAYC